jgi:hypothetical protein
MTDDLNDKVDAALARLETREDPPPPAPLPPLVEQTLLDLRLRVVVDPAQRSQRLEFLDAAGNPVPVQQGIVALLHVAAQFGSAIDALDSRVRLYCRRLGERLSELHRDAQIAAATRTVQ